MSSAREMCETAKTPEKSDAKNTSPTTEQPEQEEPYQANTVVATPEHALMRSSVITPPPRPRHTEDRSGRPMVWDPDYFERHSSSYQNHKSPCPSPRRKIGNDKNESSEPAQETGPEENPFLSRAPPLVEATATAQDPVPAQETGPEKNPFLSSAPPVETTAAAEDPVPAQETGPEENPFLSRAPPLVEATATAQDPVPAQETGLEKNPFLSSAPPVETTAAAEDPVPAQETGPEENPFLSKAPAETTATAEDIVLRSSPPILSSCSHDDQNSSETNATAEDPVPAQETGPEENPFLSRALAETIADPVLRSSPPILSSSSHNHQNSSEINSTAKDLVLAQETGPEENPFLSRALAETTADPVLKSSPPILSSSSHDHQNSSSAERNSAKSDDETIEACTETAPVGKTSLSNQPLPLDWRSSEPNPSNYSGAHPYDMSSGTIRECLAAPHRQGEAWKGVPLGENPYISKWPLPKANERTTNKDIEGPMDTAAPDVGPSQPKASLALDWRSSPPLFTSSSEANVEDPYGMGEACKGAPPGENPSPSAKSRGTNDECVEAPRDTAPGLSSSSFGYVSPTPKVPKGNTETLKLSTRPPLPTERSRFLGVHIGSSPNGLRYFSRLVIPVKRRIAKVRHQPRTPGTKRTFDAMADGGNQHATAHGEQPGPSSQNELPNPSPDSKIQKIPTKDPFKQSYSHQAYGGWRVLSAKNAAIEIDKEKREKAWRARKRNEDAHHDDNEAAVSDQDCSNSSTESAPHPGKRQRTDYPCFISCQPSDKLWKSWENKYLLRSHAAGLSFAQISASDEFSKGRVIRTEDDCREHYDTLQEWQPSQDEELLRAGESGENENFAVVCSQKFSKGLVKRSEQQCRERYSFLKNSELEGFESEREKEGADC